MLSVRGLSKSFPGDRRGGGERVAALDEVDLDVAEGQFATVLGPSGCGKTTLLRCIAGFETPDRGSITLAERPVVAPGRRPVPAHERGVGIVPQDGALFPHLTVAQNVAFGLTRRSRADRRHRVDEVLDLVDLRGLRHRRPHELSGGQQQRVALARALAPGPRLILLDEPFSALDAHLRQSVREQVHAVLQAVGATTVLVTHDQAEALALADHLVVMRDGRVAQAGPPRETYLNPQDVRLARFLGDAVVLPGRAVERGSVSCALGRLATRGQVPACANDALCPENTLGAPPCDCLVMIRPEHIRLAPADHSPGLSPSGTVGRITGRSYFGHDEVLSVRIPDVTDEVSVRVMGPNVYHTGDDVRLTVEGPVHTFPC